jgi:hypothetical protein
MDKNIYHLSYVSTCADNLSFADFETILQSANDYNKSKNLTGILIYCNKHFFQILEGDKDEILTLYSRIVIDYRHDNIVKLQEGFIKKRQFENWSMAFKSFNCELKQLDDFNNEQFYTHLNSEIANNNHPSLRILADFFDLNG